MKQNGKKCIGMVMAIGLAVCAMAGCTKAADQNMASETPKTENTAKEGTVKIPVVQDFGTLDPFASSSGTGRIACNGTFYEQLATIYDGELEPLLMKSYEQIDDVTYHVTIYDYIHDCDGNPITADDVVFSFEQCMNNGAHPKLNVLKEVSKVDDTTIAFVMNSDNPIAGSLFAAWGEVYIVSQKAYEASSDKMATRPVGTGAYKVTDYTSGISITVEKTGNYWQTDEEARSILSYDNVDEIEFQYISERSQITVGLQTGALTMARDLSMTDLAYFTEGGEYAGSFNVEEVPGNMYQYLSFNCSEDSPCNNINLRYAIAYGIDAAGIMASASGNHGVLSHAMASPVYGDYDTSWDNEDYFNYDLEKAKEYLDAYETETGRSAKELSLVLMTTTLYSTQCEIISGYLNELGINVELKSLDDAIYKTELTNQEAWDMVYGVLGASVYWVDSFNTWYNSSNYDWNGTFNFYKDDQLQELRELACSEKTHTQENINALKDYLDEICITIGIYIPTTPVIYPSYITDIVVDYRQYIVPGACTYQWSE